MLRRELALWFLFFTLCLGAGYLNGILPEAKVDFFWSQPEVVKALVYSEKLLPSFLVMDLEKRTHTTIQVDLTGSFEDFLVHSVSSSGYSIFILPRLWSESLKRQGLLLPLAGLKDFFLATLYPDFPAVESRIFPWAWIPTLFVLKSTTNLKDISSITMVEDDDHLFHILKEAPPQKPQTEIHVHSLLEEADEIADNQLKEINYFSRNDFGPVKSPDQWPQSLFLFDVVIPQKTPRKATSIALLKKLFTSEHLSSDLGDQPFGFTTRALDQTSSFPNEKKPSALRNKALQRLIHIESIELAERDRFLSKFNLKR
jgi:hypothetical protein